MKNLLLMSCRSPYLDSEKTYAPLGLLYLKSAISDLVNVDLMDEYDLNNLDSFEKYDRPRYQGGGGRMHD